MKGIIFLLFTVKVLSAACIEVTNPNIAFTRSCTNYGFSVPASESRCFVSSVYSGVSYKTSGVAKYVDFIFSFFL